VNEPLDRIDWEWSTRVSTTSERSAEYYARAVFEDGPVLLRWFVLLGWIVVLRLRLGARRSADHVLGWRIESNEAERIVLGTESFMLTVRLIVTATGGSATHATYIRYDRGIARVVWPLIAWLHKIIIVFLLKRAARA